MEIVDIVDENGKVLSQATKEEAHKKGLLHRTVIAEVFNDKKEWLLVRQASHKQDVGQFVSPMGGHVTAGESEEDALKREAEEELGFKKFTFRLKGKVIFNRTVRDHVENHYFIVYEIQSNDEPVLNSEAVEYKRFSQKELQKRLLNSPNDFGNAFHFLIKNLYPEILEK